MVLILLITRFIVKMDFMKLSLVCFFAVFCLVVGEVVHYISGEKEYNYRFDVDTALFDLPDLDIDMVIATPCNNLAVVSTMDESVGLFAPLQQSIKKDPTRFEFTEEEQMYWTVLRHAHSAMNNGGLRGLEELQYIDSDVQDNLEKLANQKQSDEAKAINQQRKVQEQNGEAEQRNFVCCF
uniref:ERGIC_N domain-containing protein n=1 Tax=Angiostrongylus cantonensis TaxID=6313 RepID=A0A0K0D7N5_ANGCA